jgi:hypothetical protein
MSDENKPPPEDDWGPREPWRQQQPEPGQPAQPGQPPYPPPAVGEPPQPGQGPWPQNGPQNGPQYGPPNGPQPGPAPWQPAGPPQGQPGWPGQQGPAGIQPIPQQSNAAQTLAIIGIVCILLCGPAAIVLGLLAQSKYREQHQPDTLAKIAWIGGIVSMILGFIILADY